MRRRIPPLLLCVLFSFCTTLAFAQSPSLPLTEHPRLWIRADDLPRLRADATDDNPIWTQILYMADEVATAMDDGSLADRDLGGYAYEEQPAENAALMFAFVSLLHPDEAQRPAYAERARTLLTGVIEQVAQGVADAPYRTPDFSNSDRSRWYGASFPLIVDWIYPVLTAEDRTLISSTFIRWCAELRTAGTTNNNHPEPIGVVNSPELTADRAYARWSNNNYYTAHMRNMGMFALALDPADDPTGALGTCLNEAIGAWLYVFDDSTRTDTAGGLGAEGMEYSPQTLGYVAQFLLALHTAGYSDPAIFGAQATFEGNPFWDDAVTAYAHSASPAPVANPDWGMVYQPAWYGSGQTYFLPDYIEVFGAMGAYDRLVGNAERLNAMQWLQLVTAPGGEEQLLERVEHEQFVHAILYYLLFSPQDAPPADPRPTMENTFYAPGMRRLLARTDWTEDARWLTYNLSWSLVDHQSAGGNAIEFYRDGEWLTQIRVGYDLDYIASDNLNTLLVGNTPPSYDDWRYMLYERGSQWLYVADDDPPPPIIEQGDGYISIFGDATPLYNSTYVGSTDVVRATRSIVWLQPELILIYDQAETTQPGFKRFVLNLPTTAAVEGNRAQMTSPGGQQFTIETLLPADATVQVAALADEPSSTPAHFQTMTHRFYAEAPNNPAQAQFLHALIAADAGASLPTLEQFTADSGAPGVRVSGIEGSRAFEVTFERDTVVVREAGS